MTSGNRKVKTHFLLPSHFFLFFQQERNEKLSTIVPVIEFLLLHKFFSCLPIPLVNF